MLRIHQGLIRAIRSLTPSERKRASQFPPVLFLSSMYEYSKLTGVARTLVYVSYFSQRSNADGIILTRWESLVVKVIGSEALGSRQWNSILPQAAAPAAPLLAASISSIFTPSATNSTCKKDGKTFSLHRRLGYLDRDGCCCNWILISRCETFGENKPGWIWETLPFEHYRSGKNVYVCLCVYVHAFQADDDADRCMLKLKRSSLDIRSWTLFVNIWSSRFGDVYLVTGSKSLNLEQINGSFIYFDWSWSNCFHLLQMTFQDNDWEMDTWNGYRWKIQ